MFLTSGVIDKDFFKEFSRKLFKPSQRIILMLVFFGMIVWGIIEYKVTYTWMGVAIWFLDGVLLVNVIFIVKGIVGQNLGRMEREEGVPELRCSTAFSSLGMLIRNDRSGAASYIPYRFFNNIIKLDHSYVLLTKKKHFALVFRKMLSEEEEREFVQYLKEQPTSIDWAKIKL